MKKNQTNPHFKNINSAVPLVSIIMPSYNSEKYLSESIESVLNQSFSNFEMIIIDDCSADNSVSVINYYSKIDSRIRLVELFKNSGAAVSRNAGISIAQGRYICFLDSDDLWLPGKLERQLAFMEQIGAFFSCTAYDKIDVRGTFLRAVCVPARVEYSDLLKTCSIGCLTAMYDTKYFGKVYMPNIRKRQDLGLWLELLKKTRYAYCLNEVLAQYRVRPDSISSNKFSAAKYQWLLYRDFQKLNLLKSCYYFGHYAVLGLIKTKAPALARRLGVLE